MTKEKCEICGKSVGFFSKTALADAVLCSDCFHAAWDEPSPIHRLLPSHITMAQFKEAQLYKKEEAEGIPHSSERFLLSFESGGFLGLSWEVHEDFLLRGFTEIPFNQICNVQHDEAANAITIQVVDPKYYEDALDWLSWSDNPLDKRLATTCRLEYKPQESNDAATAYGYIKEHSLDSTIKKMPDPDKDGVFRLRCNSCGSKFSFTAGDLQDNLKVAQRNKTAALGQLASVASGNQGAAIALKQFEGEVRSFNRCPYCNSRDVEGISAEEMAGAPNNSVSASSTSAADEIMKLKELLDAGVLTQEEFDAAKRKALGI